MSKEKEKELEDVSLDGEIAELLETVSDPLPGGDPPPEPPAKTKPKLPEKVAVEAEVVAEPMDEEEAEDLKEFIEKFNTIADKIIDNFDSDRDSIEDVIQRLKDNYIADSAKPRECIVMGLVSALRTKAETNTAIIKLLDSHAKLISATKNSNIFQSTTANIDLGALLSRDDDE